MQDYTHILEEDNLCMAQKISCKLLIILPEVARVKEFMEIVYHFVIILWKKDDILKNLIDGKITVVSNIRSQQ